MPYCSVHRDNIVAFLDGVIEERYGDGNPSGLGVGANPADGKNASLLFRGLKAYNAG